MSFSWYGDDWYMDPSYGFGFAPVGTGTVVPTPAVGGTITVPSKTIELPGIGNVIISGGTWSIGGASGTTDRDVAVTITNQYETHFQANLEAYRQGRVDREQALANFDTLWRSYCDTLRSAVSQAEADRAIGDRSTGGKFDWFTAYREPIAGSTGRVPYVGTPEKPGLATLLRQNLLWILLIVVALAYFGGRR